MDIQNQPEAIQKLTELKADFEAVAAKAEKRNPVFKAIGKARRKVFEQQGTAEIYNERAQTVGNALDKLSSSNPAEHREAVGALIDLKANVDYSRGWRERDTATMLGSYTDSQHKEYSTKLRDVLKLL
jgi:hypothetical protein